MHLRRLGQRALEAGTRRGDLVVLACAVSAGVHGALVPGHFADGSVAGLGFVAATAALAGLIAG